jgi:aminomethyltransferase
MLKKTPLYNLHLELSAKIVPYAGYLMPVQYAKGTLHEHRHCRNHAGFFDISHLGQCMILGDDAAYELGQLIPSDIADLKVGEQKYTVLTNNTGGIIDDIMITRIESGLMISVNAACKNKVFNYLRQHLSNQCLFNELTGQALFAIQGPAAASVMENFSDTATQLSFMQACGAEISGIKCNISRCGYTGEDGFEISVDHKSAAQLARLFLAEEEVLPIGLAARDTLRLEAGLCLYGQELNESITPIEADLHWMFKKNHTQYPGAKKILYQQQYGPEKIRVGLLIEGKIPVREGTVICNSAGVAIGYVTSGSFSPSLGIPIAMALIDPYAIDLDNTLYTQVREHHIAVNICPLPFITHRYHRNVQDCLLSNILYWKN